MSRCYGHATAAYVPSSLLAKFVYDGDKLLLKLPIPTDIAMGTDTKL